MKILQISNSFGFVPFHEAGLSKNKDCFELLLNYDIDPSLFQDDKFLSNALRYNIHYLISYFVNHPTLGKESKVKQILLVESAHLGNNQLLQQLLQQGFNPNIKSKGLASIHHAAIQNNEECLQLLMDYGADIDLEDKKSMTAAHHAKKIDRLKFLKFYIHMMQIFLLLTQMLFFPLIMLLAMMKQSTFFLQLDFILKKMMIIRFQLEGKEDKDGFIIIVIFAEQAFMMIILIFFES